MISKEKEKLILAMDQGTTSSRAILFDSNYAIVEQAQCEFEQHFPNSGWVEHSAMDIWQTSLDTARQAIANAGATAREIASIGITNQRETTVIWDRQTGQPIHNAIVWQDRRTADLCDKLKAEGLEPMISGKTGLLLDPYFSATKITWLLDNINGARARAERGELAFGTMDSWLLWNLTAGKSHATDATNASRTLLYNIHSGEWDSELLALFNIPQSLLPEVKDCAADFGSTDLFGDPIAIMGMAGDQHAATLGQACFEKGMLKSTYGTGCFALLNTGETAVTQAIDCSPPSPINWMAKLPTPSRDQSLSPVRQFNGCAMVSALSTPPNNPVNWPLRQMRISRSI